MKRHYYLYVLMCTMLISIHAFSQDMEVKPIITVLELDSENLSKAEKIIIEDYITTKIINSDAYIVIDRKQRNVILEEIEFSLSECSDESCQIQLGKLLSADKIVVGSINKIEEMYILNLKQIDVETGITNSSFTEQYDSISEIIGEADTIVFEFLLKSTQISNPTEKQDTIVIRILNELSHLSLGQLKKKQISDIDLYSLGITNRMYIYKEVKKSDAWLFCTCNCIPGLGSLIQGDHIWGLYQMGSFILYFVSMTSSISNPGSDLQPWQIVCLINGAVAVVSGFVTPWMYESSYNSQLKKKLLIP